jgi:hypothetical protein
VLLASAVLSCASNPAGWDFGALGARHPEVDVHGQHLAEALPYFAPAGDELALFLCRWAGDGPVHVWLPASATPSETAVLRRALQAWEGAGLGIDPQPFEGTPPRTGIVFELLDPEPGETVSSTGDTIADCSIPFQVDPTSDTPVDAELQYASIQLRRSLPDALGRLVPLTEMELLGAAVHELGHALGFPGHVARGGGVMVAHDQVDAARHWGKRLEAGRPLEAPTLVALYRLPSGVRVGRLPLTRAQRDPLHAVSAIASRVGLRGPYARVGDESARLLWRDDDGASYAIVLLDWAAALHDPKRLEPRLDRRARLLLESAGG